MKLDYSAFNIVKVVQKTTFWGQWVFGLKIFVVGMVVWLPVLYLFSLDGRMGEYAAAVLLVALIGGLIFFSERRLRSDWNTRRDVLKEFALRNGFNYRVHSPNDTQLLPGIKGFPEANSVIIEGYADKTGEFMLIFIESRPQQHSDTVKSALYAPSGKPYSGSRLKDFRSEDMSPGLYISRYAIFTKLDMQNFLCWANIDAMHS